MSAKPTDPKHELRIVPDPTPLGGRMKKATCACGWRSDLSWYGDGFVEADYRMHVREARP